MKIPDNVPNSVPKREIRRDLKTDIDVNVGEFWNHYKKPGEVDAYIVRGLYLAKPINLKDDEECVILKNKLTGEMVIIPEDKKDKFINPEFEIIKAAGDGENILCQVMNSTNGEQDFILYKKPGEKTFYLRPKKDFLGKVMVDGVEVDRFKKLTFED